MSVLTATVESPAPPTHATDPPVARGPATAFHPGAGPADAAEVRVHGPARVVHPLGRDEVLRWRTSDPVSIPSTGREA